MADDEKSSETLETVKDLLKRKVEYAMKIIDFKREIDSFKFMPSNKTVSELRKMSTDATVALSKVSGRSLDGYPELFDEIQGFRDRASDIQTDAFAQRNFVENTYEELHRIWIRHSDAKSQDRRESEAEDILFFCSKKRRETQNLVDASNTAIYNLNRKHDALKEKMKAVIHMYRISSEPENIVDNAVKKDGKISQRDKRPSARTTENKTGPLDWSEIGG